MDKPGDKGNNHLPQNWSGTGDLFANNSTDDANSPESKTLGIPKQDAAIEINTGKIAKFYEIKEKIQIIISGNAEEALANQHEFSKTKEAENIRIYTMQSSINKAIAELVSLLEWKNASEEDTQEARRKIQNILRDTFDTNLNQDKIVDVIANTTMVILDSPDIKNALYELKQYSLELFLNTLQNALSNTENFYLSKIFSAINTFTDWLPIHRMRYLNKDEIDKMKSIIQEMLGKFLVELQQDENPNFSFLKFFEKVFSLTIESKNLDDFVIKLQKLINQTNKNHPSVSARKAIADYEDVFNEKVVFPETLEAFNSGRVESTLLYYNFDAFRNLVYRQPTYNTLEVNLNLIVKNREEIVEIVAPKKIKHVTVTSLGPGTGENEHEVVCGFLDQGKNVHLQLADASPEALQDSVFYIADRLLTDYILKTSDNNSNPNSSWENLINLINEFDAKLSSNHRHWIPKVNYTIRQAMKENWAEEWLKNRLYRWLQEKKLALPENFDEIIEDIQNAQEKLVTIKSDDGKTPIPIQYPPELLKHIFARMLGKHKYGINNDDEFICKLDNETPIPLKISLYADKFENLENSILGPTNKTHGSLFVDLGNRFCNDQFDAINSIPLYDRILTIPKPPRNLKKQIIGLKDEKKLNAKYGLTGIQISNFDIGDEGFTKETKKIKSGYVNQLTLEFLKAPFKTSDIHYSKIQDGQSTQTYLEDISMLSIDYKKDDKRKGEHAGWFKIDTNFEFTKDVNITIANGDDVISKQKGDQLILPISYKPTIKQVVSLFEDYGFKIVKIYLDNDDLPSHAQFLIRKMTKFENKTWEKEHNKDPERHFKDKKKTTQELKIRRKRGKHHVGYKMKSS